MDTAEIVALAVAAAIIVILAVAVMLKRAPVCTCGDVDCGGGCLRRR